MTWDLSQPPACWGWDIPLPATEDPHLQMAGADLVGKNAPIGGSPALWQFVQFHQDRCAICGQHPAQLVVDHDHWSGLVRGLLCFGCNSSEGKLWTTSLMAFAGYRQRHPAVILGYHEPYRATSTCVAFDATLARKSADWRRTLRRIDSLASRLVGERPHPDTAAHWPKALRKVERLWLGIADAEPLGPGALNRVETLRDLMTIVVGLTSSETAGSLLGELDGLVRRQQSRRSGT